jgi:hypothetical protein
MAFVGGIAVPVVEVVDVIAVGDGGMSALVTVNVGVVGVLDVGGHRCSSCECRMASLTM